MEPKANAGTQPPPIQRVASQAAGAARRKQPSPTDSTKPTIFLLAACFGLAAISVVVRTVGRPDVHSALSPRSMAIGVDIPRLRSNTFAVVADICDDVPGPRFVEAERGAVSRNGPEQPRDIRILALRHLADVGRRDAQFFGGDHREDGPPQDVEQVDVLPAHELRERLAA